MSSRADRAGKQQKDKYQVVLNDLLREEANRYCADCEAKGPRWASWNIGVFMCIRCAGIHRNLGVHISRVKSVNLDSWTAEQIESIQKWGNKRARDHYECYLPADFLRPQGDSAMETLIRNKYERKLYIRKGGEPPPNRGKEPKPVQPQTKEKQPEAKKDKAVESKVIQSAPAASVPRPTASQTVPVKSTAAPILDLLGMDDPAPRPSAQQAAAQNDDEFSMFMQATPANATAQVSQPHNVTEVSNGDSLLLEDKSEKKINTKESILSLYQSGNQQQKPVYGVPGGVYMTQQHPNQRDQQNAFGLQGMNQQMMGAHQQRTGMNQQGMQAMNMNQAQMTMNNQQMAMNNQQMAMNQPQMQMNQAQMQMNQPQMQMNQNQMRLNQNQMGMNQNMGMNLRMQQNQPMMQNMASLQSQMQGMNVGHMNQLPRQAYNPGSQVQQGAARPQYMQSNVQSNFGQAMMANSYGSNRPLMPSQQPILANGPAMGFVNANLATSPNMGQTLNNQLWK